MRRASGPTVTLFPFLTVLLCASGTLIVLLIALSQHVRDNPAVAPTAAEAPAADPVDAPANPPVVATVAPVEEPPPLPAPPALPAPPPDVPQVPLGPPRIARLPYRGPDPTEPLRQRLSAAQRIADEATAALAATSDRRATAEARTVAARMAVFEATAATQSTRTRLASLERSRNAAAAAAERAAAEIVAFRQKIEAAQADDSPRSLLPVVRTPDGVTADRPILIECVAAGATLHPYGVTVPGPFLGSSPDAPSPVVAGVRAAAAATGEGYVLLIVRPAGLPAFYQTADALSSAGIRFGYELLDADAKIAWGDARPQDAAQVDAAVREALRRAVPITDDGFERGPAGPGGRPTGAGGAGGDGPGDSRFGGRSRGTGDDRMIAAGDEPGRFGTGPSGGGADGRFDGGTGREGSNPPSAMAGNARPVRDLSGSFPSGSPADRLVVGDPVPARANASTPAAPLPAASGAIRPGERSPGATPMRGAAGGASGGGGPAEGRSSADGSPSSPNDSRSETRESGSGGRTDSQSDSQSDRRSDSQSNRQSDSQSNRQSGGAAGGASGSSRSGSRDPSTGGGGGGNGRGGAAGRDKRIRFTVRTPATLAASHLWIGGRWVALPSDDEQLIATLRTEFDRKLADRGDPPPGFRWSPELRLRVRADGRGQVARLTDAAEQAGGAVKLDRGTR